MNIVLRKLTIKENTNIKKKTTTTTTTGIRSQETWRKKFRYSSNCVLKGEKIENQVRQTLNIS